MVVVALVPGGNRHGTRTHHPVAELFKQERSTPEEVAELLGIGERIVQHAAFSGKLHTQIFGQDSISIRRVDVPAGLSTRDGLDREFPTGARD